MCLGSLRGNQATRKWGCVAVKQPDDFFKEEWVQRYSEYLDPRTKEAIRGLTAAIRAYFDTIRKLDEAAEVYYPSGAAEPQPIGRGARSGGAPGSRLDGLDKLLRFTVPADCRDIERLIDAKSRRIIAVLRGTAESGKLTEVERSQIAHRLKKESATKLAREYGISRSRVYQLGRQHG